MDIRKIPNLKNEKNCVACGNCVVVCPQKAIKMVQGKINLYPEIDNEKCVKCYKCIEACNATYKPSKTNVTHYICQSRDKEILKKSSSGGVFSLLSDFVLSRHGVVFGAAYCDEKLSVMHIACKTKSELYKCQKSKYVQSDHTVILNELEKSVKEKKWILFTGTPCQCDSIKRKYCNYERLIIADFYCHGVSNIGVFSNYLSEIGGAEVVDFRSEGAQEPNFYITIKNKNKSIQEYASENIFYRLFISSANIKKACFDCAYANKTHPSDFTMGDFDYPELLDARVMQNHVSILSINTDKGTEIFESIKDQFFYKKITDNKILRKYYRKHNELNGDWGYDLDKQHKFISDYEKNGFWRAGYKSEYLEDLELCLRIIKESGDAKVWFCGAGRRSKILGDIIKNLNFNINFAGYIDSNIHNKESDDCIIKQFENISEDEAYNDIFVITVYGDLKLVLKEKLDRIMVKRIIM